MPYNELLADRVREALFHLNDVEEKKIFRGLTFMVNGKMCVSIGEDRIMFRVNPLQSDEIVEKYNCRTMSMKGRDYKGFIIVEEEALKNKKVFDYFISLSIEFNKIAKASPKKKKRTP